MNELKLKISGFVVSIVSYRKNAGLKVGDAYRTFITNEQPDMIIRVHYGAFPRLDLEEEIFDSGATWRLFRSNGKYVFKVPSRMAVIDPDFKYGDIYVKPSLSFAARYYPLQYPLDELIVINLLSRGRGLLVHACGLSYQGKGILFAGGGGAGKSTMANLYKGRRKTALLSDDRIIIRKMDNEFYIYGTPWHGDARICSPGRAPLERIFFLRHAPENKVKKIDLIDATSRLIVCSFPTFWDKKGMAFTLRFCAELAEKVPCYILDFLPDKGIIDFIRDEFNV